LPVQLLDLLDGFIHLGDLLVHEGVARLLAFDLGVVIAVDEEPQQHAGQDRQDDHDHEFLLALGSALGAPREQVDPGHQSKLLNASPQAIISAGASWASACAWTRDPRVMCASGLATVVGTPSCSSTISDTPGMDAQPPASTIWSTRLNSLPA